MRTSLLLLLLVASACGGDDGSDDGPGPPDPTPTGDTGTTGTTDPACIDAPGWDEAQGYLRTWCLPCHSEAVSGDDRQGAPPGSDFDTYAQVWTWRAAIEARATGPDADMPPVPGASAESLERFAWWLSCGAEGSDPEPGPCAALVPSAGPAVVSNSADADTFCASGNQGADLTVHVDLPCLCDVTGDVVVHGGSLPLLGAVAGDLHLADGSPQLPVLRKVEGDVRTEGSATTLALPQLEAVGGDLWISDAPQAVDVDLSGLLTVDGALTIEGLAALATVDLSRLRVVGGPLRLADLPALTTLTGLVAVEAIGRGPDRSGADQGGIELVGLGRLEDLDTFRLLTVLGGPVTIEANPVLVEIDGFTTLAALPHPVRIAGHPQLQALEGFDLLTTVGDLEVVDNPALANVFGFVNLAGAGAVSVDGSPALRSLNGLGALQQVGGLQLSHLGLQDVPWFTQLHTIDGDLVISNMPGLGRVSGLPAVTAVHGDVLFRSNPLLLEISGPGTLESVDGTVALDTLPNLATVAWLDALQSTGGDLRVASTGLDQLDDLAAVRSVAGDLAITGNPDLPAAVVSTFASGVTVDGTVELSDNGP